MSREDKISRIHVSLDAVIKDLQRELNEKGIKVTYVGASKHLAKLYNIEARTKYSDLAKEIIEMWG